MLLLGLSFACCCQTLLPALFDPKDFASLQRGAKYFMNYCSGCHSLRFLRYNQCATDLKIISIKNLTYDKQRLNKNLIFAQANFSDTIKSSLDEEDAMLWFGKLPPDLSLITRIRGIDWVYTYLLGFYTDKSRPFGVNNYLLKNTQMPDALWHLRHKSCDIKYLSMGMQQKNLKACVELRSVANDLVNFLMYAADPRRNNRRILGYKIESFLFLFLVLIYFLKKQIFKHCMNQISRSSDSKEIN